MGRSSRPRAPGGAVVHRRGGTLATVVDGPAAFEALRAAGWDELLDRVGPRDPLRRLAVLGLRDDMGASRSPRALVVERAGEAVAAAALSVGRERGLRVVRHLGNLVNWYAPEPPAVDADALGDLAASLANQPGDLLTLAEITRSHPIVSALARTRADVEIIPEPSTFRVDLREALPRLAKRRREARRLGRRAAELGSPMRTAVSGDGSTIAGWLDEMMALAVRSWRGRAPEPYTRFEAGRDYTRRAVLALASEGRARASRVDLGARMASFHVAGVWGDYSVIYRSATERSLSGLPGGIGWASLLAILESLASEGVRWADMGHGGEDYKRHLAPPTPLAAVRLPLSAAGSLYLRAAAARRACRSRVRTRQKRGEST
jgi:CelD/BcsL family acetyltransferase involved in cellulose biosynthesis